MLADLKRALKQRGQRDSIAIFYGTAHMSDFEKRIQSELGYHPVDEIWFEAMSVDCAAAGLSDAEVKSLRSLARRQVGELKTSGRH